MWFVIRYTRVIKVGASANRTATVPCPGCYQCREVPHPPGTVDEWYRSDWYRKDFHLDVRNPGAANAVVEASLRTRYVFVLMHRQLLSVTRTPTPRRRTPSMLTECVATVRGKPVPRRIADLTCAVWRPGTHTVVP